MCNGADSDVTSDPAWQDGASFHAGGASIYTELPGAVAPPPLLKQRAGMAHVRYSPAHPAPDVPGTTGAPSWLAGAGNADTVWLASEQPGTAEHVTRGGLLGAFDTWLDPGASIGWHVHGDSEEMYVLIAGALTVRAGTNPAQASEFHLAPGEVHRIPHTWGHAALAGPTGARLLVVEWRAGAAR